MGVVSTQLDLTDGQGALVGVVGGVEVPQAAKHEPEVVEAAAHLGLIWAKPRLEDRVGALDELPRLLKLGPPPQVGADLVEQAGDGLRVTTEAAGMVGDDQGMGEQPGAGCRDLSEYPPGAARGAPSRIAPSWHSPQVR
jgi:hypothetical protein